MFEWCLSINKTGKSAGMPNAEHKLFLYFTQARRPKEFVGQIQSTVLRGSDIMWDSYSGGRHKPVWLWTSCGEVSNNNETRSSVRTVIHELPLCHGDMQSNKKSTQTKHVRPRRQSIHWSFIAGNSALLFDLDQGKMGDSLGCWSKCHHVSLYSDSWIAVMFKVFSCQFLLLLWQPCHETVLDIFGFQFLPEPVIWLAKAFYFAESAARSSCFILQHFGLFCFVLRPHYAEQGWWCYVTLWVREALSWRQMFAKSICKNGQCLSRKHCHWLRFQSSKCWGYAAYTLDAWFAKCPNRESRWYSKIVMWWFDFQQRLFLLWQAGKLTI